MPWRALFIIVVVAIVLAAFGVLMQRSDELLDTAAPEQPGYYLQEAVVTDTDASGAARMRLRAASIKHHPADDSIDAQQVALDYQIAPDAQWLLTAERGHVPAASRAITFSGNVIVQPANEHTMPVTMRTDTLAIDTLNDLASAPGKVIIEMNQRRLTGIGLKADLKQQQVRIESQVHGQFSIQ